VHPDPLDLESVTGSMSIDRGRFCLFSRPSSQDDSNNYR
jgi:hypothetical protein